MATTIASTDPSTLADAFIAHAHSTALSEASASNSAPGMRNRGTFARARRPVGNGKNAIPQTLVIASDGRIISHWNGYSRGRSGDHLRETIERALSETSAGAKSQ